MGPLVACRLALHLVPPRTTRCCTMTPRATAAAAAAAADAVRLQEADTAPSPPAEPSRDEMTINEPYSEMELAEQEAKLTALSEKWSKFEAQKDYETTMRSGFGPSPEIINGRTAMFFLITGLITEYYTGQSMPQQV